MVGRCSVQRRNNGLPRRRPDEFGYGGQYDSQHGGAYGHQLSFRCNVAYKRAVNNIRINRPQANRG
jgi:hypothetical protein